MRLCPPSQTIRRYFRLQSHCLWGAVVHFSLPASTFHMTFRLGQPIQAPIDLGSVITLKFTRVHSESHVCIAMSYDWVRVKNEKRTDRQLEEMWDFLTHWGKIPGLPNWLRICTTSREENRVYTLPSTSKPKKQVHDFLGLTKYYRRFVANFSSIAFLLTDRTRKAMPEQVSWTPEAERVFLQLKEMVTPSPILQKLQSTLSGTDRHLR